MYTRRLKCADQRWRLLLESTKCSVRLYNHNNLMGGSKFIGDNIYNRNFLKRYLPNSFTGQSVTYGKKTCLISGTSEASPVCHQLRFYSSEGDGRNASENKHMPVGDRANFDKRKIHLGEASKDLPPCDEHARLSQQDQKEWLIREKTYMESKKQESPFLTKRDKFKKEFLRRVVPWEKINVSWDTFPYYIHEHIKNLLVECASSHLKHKKIAVAYGSRLSTSTGRILLQSIPGTELYRERLVRALARDLRVPVLVLDSSILAPYDLDDNYASENKSDDGNASSVGECTSDIDTEDENDTSSREAKTDVADDEEVLVRAIEALKKLVPFNIEGLEELSEEPESLSESSKADDVQAYDKSRPLRKGDCVKYIGPSAQVEANNRMLLGKISTSDGPMNAYTVIQGRDLPTGQRGEVYEVDGEHVAVILDTNDDTANTGEDSDNAEHDPKPSVCWIHVKNIERDLDQLDCYIAMEALYEVLQNKEPLIVYFHDSTLSLLRAVPKSSSEEFIIKVEDMFSRLSVPILLIGGQNKVETGSLEKDRSTMTLPDFARNVKLPLSLRKLPKGVKASMRREDNDMYKLFTNVMILHPPKEEELLQTFNKQLEEDRHIAVSRSNVIELHKILEEHELSCMDLLQVDTDGVILTRKNAEKVVGWARNHYISSCLLPSIIRERLAIPRESLEIAILRLKEQEAITGKPSQSLKNLAKDQYESNFISAVVPPGEIGVRFDDVGALEDVKKALHELVILPMKRPELFAHGNLLRPCKGILLFGPPGTGKTLLAKALATEAGANFISITGSTLTSKWFGDAEKLTKALFSFASKLSPVIIFVDEVDSLLGARGGAFEHEATRRMRNEFMAAWDGLRTKDTQKILILGATNRPFDLDDAVIRRLPRRIYVDLPDAGNRTKILKIFLSDENLEPDFDFDKLATVTEGYSGSDLKNLCIAAAYRPVQQLLEAEKDINNNQATVLRPLKLEDFIQSKAKVGASIAYDAASMNELRKWNDQYGEGGSRRQSPFGF